MKNLVGIDKDLDDPGLNTTPRTAPMPLSQLPVIFCPHNLYLDGMLAKYGQGQAEENVPALADLE
jgi:hypothetical protein